MKKVLVGILLSAFLLTGCEFNKQIIDLEYMYNTAIINDIGEVSVSKWNDYENSDMIQIVDTNGNVYLTHSSNVILMYKK